MNKTGFDTCPTGYELSTMLNSCYQYHEEMKNWHDALQSCKSNGNGRLVTISSQLENNYVQSISSRVVFIGYNDIVTEGVFVWSDHNENSSYVNWHPAEPNDYNGEDCAAMIFGDGRWSDVPCTMLAAFVCEANVIKHIVCNKCPPGTFKLRIYIWKIKLNTNNLRKGSDLTRHMMT